MSRKSPINWYCPSKPRPLSPLFLFVPGMDGTGKLYQRQVRTLSPHFDLRCLMISPDDLSDWDKLADRVILLLQESRKDQGVYLCGESFGGCLALQIVLKAPELVDKLILVNSASSFNNRPILSWGIEITRAMPDFLHYSSTLALLPFLAALNKILPDDRKALLQAMQSVPPVTVSWRLSMLRNFCPLPSALHRVDVDTLVIASEADRLLPSVEEGRNLVQRLPKAQLMILPDSGHTCLLEDDIDLAQILADYNFFPHKAGGRKPEMGRRRHSIGNSN
ncbi:MAG: putative aminoacrylate hydrolase RutD [Chroococcopsis gigantea SAG 12.99]|jgi:pimeloyl-ACP methyl ester carboxylesterase|nr:alpha/beta hydrolase [Chlorogloea purpurea SAG 13.99]MDV2999055.1 putative aminoacrylate hydrolase RutD [Chroococcopsis gigantea SAG 12.99]